MPVACMLIIMRSDRCRLYYNLMNNLMYDDITLDWMRMMLISWMFNVSKRITTNVDNCWVSKQKNYVFASVERCVICIRNNHHLKLSSNSLNCYFFLVKNFLQACVIHEMSMTGLYISPCSARTLVMVLIYEDIPSPEEVCTKHRGFGHFERETQLFLIIRKTDRIKNLSN